MSINGIEYKRFISPTDGATKLRMPVSATRALVVCDFRSDIELGPDHEKNVLLAVDTFDDLVAMLQLLVDINTQRFQPSETTLVAARQLITRCRGGSAAVAEGQA